MHTRLLKTSSNGSKRPVHEAGVRVEDVAVEFGQGGVEVGAVSKFHGD
jgi:hypothetical protein